MPARSFSVRAPSISPARLPHIVLAATVVGAFGAPAGPSMQALLTLAAPPGETGRVLAGLSILQSAAVALRGPVLVSLFNATLEKAPGAIWWLSAVSGDQDSGESVR